MDEEKQAAEVLKFAIETIARVTSGHNAACKDSRARVQFGINMLARIMPLAIGRPVSIEINVPEKRKFTRDEVIDLTRATALSISNQWHAVVRELGGEIAILALALYDAQQPKKPRFDFLHSRRADQSADDGGDKSPPFS
jgi:hypothetical protein